MSRTFLIFTLNCRVTHAEAETGAETEAEAEVEGQSDGQQTEAPKMTFYVCAKDFYSAFDLFMFQLESPHQCFLSASFSFNQLQKYSTFFMTESECFYLF